MTINAYQLRCGIHGGDTTTFENKYCTFKTNRGQDGSAFKRALGSFEYTQLDCNIMMVFEAMVVLNFIMTSIWAQVVMDIPCLDKNNFSKTLYNESYKCKMKI